MLRSSGLGVAALGWKNVSCTIKTSRLVLRFFQLHPASAHGGSAQAPGTVTRGRMSVNSTPSIPVFAAVGDNTLPHVDSKCLIRIVSYNILAQAYVKSVSFPTSPRASLRWKNRSAAVVSRLLSLDADLLCLQELDEFDTYYKEILRKEGYESVYIQRGNQKRDGCGIFFRHSTVTLLAEEVIDYNDLVPPRLDEEPEDASAEDSSDKAAQKRGDMNDVRVRLQRDCVGIIAAFRPVAAPSRVLIVTSTHIFWDPVLMDVKLAQVRYLAERLIVFQKKIAEEFNVEPLLFVTGDFNSLPGDTVYNYVTSGVDKSLKVKALEKLDGALEEGLSISEEQSVASGFGQAEGERIMGLVGKYPLPLVSLYAYVDKEPSATNFTHKFVGTLDYIFFIPSKHFKPTSLLVLPPRDAPDVVSGLPNNHHPSDHLPIGSDLEIY